MKTHAFFLALLAVFALGTSGCATIQDNAGKIGGGIVGGAVMHALTGGASTAWQAAATIGGVGAGAVVGGKLDKK